jgi:stage II sporulation protein AA (anti-sigma F factor antagonist)
LYSNLVRQAIEECLGNNEYKVVLDFKQVPFIDSSGLEILVEAQNRLQKKGGGLKIAHPNPVCQDILIATRLADRIEIYSDTEDAGRSFS